MSATRLQRMRATLDRRQPDLGVLLDGVHKSHNISAILRTCDAVGVPEIGAVWPGERVRVHSHIAGGAARWVDVTPYVTVAEAVAVAHGAGQRVYAAHFSTRARDFRAMDYVRPCTVLLGSELDGVGTEAAALADEHITIPMAGLGASLNVPVAAAVILFEAQRQREAAGLYQRCGLDPERYRRTLFEWLQPRVAADCQRRGLAYPDLDDGGHVVPAGCAG